jgi:hypothetical protein
VTSEDQFIEFDAAYALGALSDDDRVAFEEHLIGCAECRDRVLELADLPALLALVPESAYDVQPDPGLDPVVVLLTTIRARRRRRRAIVGAMAALAAACLVTLTALVAGHQSKPATPAPAVAMTALIAAPIHATAQVTNVAWGTRIELRCTYDEASGYPSGEYTLVVRDRSGHVDMLGTWDVVPGKVTTFPAGTAVHLRDIKTISIDTSSGTPVLELSY